MPKEGQMAKRSRMLLRAKLRKLQLQARNAGGREKPTTKKHLSRKGYNLSFLELKPRQDKLEEDIANNTFGLADHWADVEQNHPRERYLLIENSSLSPSTISKYKSV